MGMLSDKMNEDFDRRIKIAEDLGIDVHGEEMMNYQLYRKVFSKNIALKKLKKILSDE